MSPKVDHEPSENTDGKHSASLVEECCRVTLSKSEELDQPDQWKTSRLSAVLFEDAY